MKLLPTLTLIVLSVVLPVSAQDVSKGVELYEAHKYADAEKVLRQAVQNEPENAKSLQYLGMTLTRQDKASEGEEFLRKASGLDPKSASIKLALAGAYIEEKKYDQGEAAIGEAAAIDSEARDLPFYRGMLNVYRKNFEPAIPDLETALEQDPNNAFAHYYLGLAYSGTKHPDKMVAQFEAFLRMVPDGPESKRVKSFLKSVR